MAEQVIEQESEKEEKERYQDSELYRIRHSAAHVMAQAVMEMFPGEAKLAIGAAHRRRFLLRFRPAATADPRRPGSDREAHAPDHRRQLPIRARGHQRRGSPETVRWSALQTGADRRAGRRRLRRVWRTAGRKNQRSRSTSRMISSTFAAGPHVESTGKINPAAVKLLNVAGAYWRGDEKRQMLQRIYGNRLEKTPKQLKEYLNRLEEAKKRDHRRLGKELDLFSNLPGGRKRVDSVASQRRFGATPGGRMGQERTPQTRLCLCLYPTYWASRSVAYQRSPFLL